MMFIRHAEKPQVPSPDGVDESGANDKHSLTPRGWQRAGALVKFFSTPYRSDIDVPDSIFAAGVSTTTLDDVANAGPAAGDDSRSRRSEETVTPLARKLGPAKLDTSVSVGSEDTLIQRLRNETGIVLIAWEHKRLRDIVSAFVSDAPKWDGSRFDMVWVLDKQPDNSYRFTQVPQDVLDGDEPAGT